MTDRAKAPNTRCLEHNHWFPEDELYDDDGEPFPNQLDVCCKDCGITMRESLHRMMAECKQMMEGRPM